MFGSDSDRLCDLTKRYEQAARVCERVEEDVGPAQGPRLYGIGMLGAVADVANRLFSGCKNAIQAWPWRWGHPTLVQTNPASCPSSTIRSREYVTKPG